MEELQDVSDSRVFTRQLPPQKTSTRYYSECLLYLIQPLFHQFFKNISIKYLFHLVRFSEWVEKFAYMLSGLLRNSIESCDEKAVISLVVFCIEAFLLTVLHLILKGP